MPQVHFFDRNNQLYKFLEAIIGESKGQPKIWGFWELTI